MAFLTCWACVLVGGLSASLTRASDLSDLYPPLWKESPGQLSDYPVENGTYIINPWVFSEKMGVYKILLNKTATYFAKFAPENEQNLLWGLPLQHGWQYTSGRLADPSQRTDCGYESDHLCVSVDSWWADLNYFLSVIPFLAAVDSGVLGISSDQIRFLPPPKDQTRFCYDVSGCHSSFSEIMKKWIDFYQYMKLPTSNFDDLLKYLWDAHTISLKTSVKSFEDRYAFYSEKESEFEKNWIIAVEYIGASRIPTTLIRVHKSQKGLPPRILVDTDIAPVISDFTVFQNTVLLGLSTVGKVHKSSEFHHVINQAFPLKAVNGKFLIFSQLSKKGINLLEKFSDLNFPAHTLQYSSDQSLVQLKEF
ncbi:protein LEG1 homolog [Urocitellus parryii]|uniref:protein LEG1 homolog n=1 Tax=Urocitellus parryii TaxID=9999 RepID=UPI000E558F3B|nr:protein LEG1 homolog [Urocitellus parryii]